MKYLVNRETKEHKIFKDLWEVLCRGKQWDLVQADSEGWIHWSGGECPLPDGFKHEVLFSRGTTYNDDKPQNWQWQKGSNIVAYRPILPRQSDPRPAGAAK